MNSKASLLKENPTVASENSIFSMVNMAATVFGIKDKTQISVVKAVNGLPGLPKKKHINLLLGIIISEPQEFENILMYFNSITDWEDNKTISCKILMSILLLIQYGSKESLMKGNDALLFVLNGMREFWISKEQCLSQFALFIIQKVNFIQEHLEFYEHFNLKTLSSNGMTLPSVDSKSAVALLSHLVCGLDSIIHFMTYPVKGFDSNDKWTATERATITSALIILIEDAVVYNIAVNKMIEYVSDEERKKSPIAWKTLVEQYLNQINQLTKICQYMSSQNLFTEERSMPKFIQSDKI